MNSIRSSDLYSITDWLAAEEDLVTSFTFAPLEGRCGKSLAREVVGAKKIVEIQGMFTRLGITPKRAERLALELKEESWIEEGEKQTAVKGLKFRVSELGAQIIHNGKLVDLQTEIAFISPDESRLSRKEVQKIHDFVVRNKEELRAQIQEAGESAYFSSRETTLARSIQFTEDGRVFLHFNKKSKAPVRDYLLGKGTYKVVTVAIEVFSLERRASLSMGVKEAENELYFSSFLQESEGFLHYEDKVLYNSPKRGNVKVRLLAPIYDRGSLHSLLETLSFQEKELIIYQLIRATVFMHSKGVLHRDLKPENILVNGRDESIKVVISDFGYAMHEDDLCERNRFVGTPPFFAPEYVNPERVLEQVTTKQIDIWALGTLFDEVLHRGRRKFAPEALKSKQATYRALLDYQEKREPESEEGLEHLIWQMLRKDPDERMKTEELRQWLEKRTA